MLGWFKKNANPPERNADAQGTGSFKVVVVEFSDNVESRSGENLAEALKTREGLLVGYYDEPFAKDFLGLESRTLFDLIDKGQDIVDKTGADVLVWGCREDGRIRLNFQADRQYDTDAPSFLSLMDSLFVPADLLSGPSIPSAVTDLVYGAAVASVKAFSKETAIRKRYLLRRVIDKLSRDNSARLMPVECLPFVMNFLGVIYLSYAFDGNKSGDFKVVKSLFQTALKHQDLITSPVHLGCIYNHIGQLYDSIATLSSKKAEPYFKGAISHYRQAQKFLGKYAYPYDYGYISFKLSELLFGYWRKTEDIQALRDCVFQLREAEKVYAYSVFPEFWALLQGKLGHAMAILGRLTDNAEISELAVAAYKNRQKVVTERKDPLLWAQTQENIGDIYYRLGRADSDRTLLEGALECYHDALYIFENMNLSDASRALTASIKKTSAVLGGL